MYFRKALGCRLGSVWHESDDNFLVKISFGVNLAPGEPLLSREDTTRFSDLVKMAEDSGAEALGTYDSAFVGGDAFVRATIIALASSRARVGLRPTNPMTRE